MFISSVASNRILICEEKKRNFWQNIYLHYQMICLFFRSDKSEVKLHSQFEVGAAPPPPL